MKKKLTEIYKTLLARFGHRGWWPGDTPFEICVGAVLTQNTSWKNVEKAIANLKADSALDLKTMTNMETEHLAELIKPSGYYNLKAKRLKALLQFMNSLDSGDWRGFLKKEKLSKGRELLLSVYGIGPETADSILLYAIEKPAFVIDKYTLRFGSRYGLFPEETVYEEARNLFMNSLPKSVKLFNEYHALIVALGNGLCKPKPDCANCPLVQKCQTGRSRKIFAKSAV